MDLVYLTRNLLTDDDGRLSAGSAPLQRAPSPTHLSPYNVPPVPVVPRNLPSTPQQRPPSWMSVSTTGSRDEPFDADIYDSFPSVPGVAQSRQQQQPLSGGHGYQYKSMLSPGDHVLPTSVSEFGGLHPGAAAVSRSTTMPGRPNTNPKHRPGLI